MLRSTCDRYGPALVRGRNGLDVQYGRCPAGDCVVGKDIEGVVGGIFVHAKGIIGSGEIRRDRDRFGIEQDAVCRHTGASGIIKQSEHFGVFVRFVHQELRCTTRFGSHSNRDEVLWVTSRPGGQRRKCTEFVDQTDGRCRTRFPICEQRIVGNWVSAYQFNFGRIVEQVDVSRVDAISRS